VFFLSGLPSEARRWRGVRRAYDLISHHRERGACAFADVVLAEIAFTDFGNRCELGIIETTGKATPKTSQSIADKAFWNNP